MYSIGSGESQPGVSVNLWYWREGVEQVTHHTVEVTEKDCTLVGRALNTEDKLEKSKLKCKKSQTL